jgi:sensor histidine kinase YesM
LNKFLFHNELQYRLSRQIVFFVSLVAIFTLVLYSRSEAHSFWYFLKITFVNALIFLGYGYLTVFILVPLFLPSRKYFYFAVSFLCLGFLLSALKLLVSDFIFYSSIAPEIIGSKGILSIRFILVNTKDMSFIAGLFVVVKFTKDWLIAENQHKSLQEKYDDLNLRMLQSHFEPHFLFNTLNNLYALSLVNPNKTLEVIRRFKRVLQFAITESQTAKVPLQHELEMIRDFLEIEQIRYGARLQLKFRTTGNCENLEIAPLLLFTLVENCFKHGSSSDAGNPWIEISLKCADRKLVFETGNSIPKLIHVPEPSQEKGLRRLRKRLGLIYPDKYVLEFHEESERFDVKLELNLNE